jgi:hypothetical protein
MTTDDDHTRRRQAIEEWWATLSAQERDDAKSAVEAGNVPDWMATSLTEKLGVAVMATWWVGDPEVPADAPFQVADELAELIAEQPD